MAKLGILDETTSRMEEHDLRHAEFLHDIGHTQEAIHIREQWNELHRLNGQIARMQIQASPQAR
jgi:hypothetical protein